MLVSGHHKYLSSVMLSRPLLAEQPVLFGPPSGRLAQRPIPATQLTPSMVKSTTIFSPSVFAVSNRQLYGSKVLYQGKINHKQLLV